MNVKSLLRELIKDGSGQAMPGIKVVNIDNSASTYVAPADGYARLSCRANGVNDWWVVRTPENNLEGGFAAPGANAYARINAESLEMAQTVAAGAGYSTSLRVRKGNTLNMYFSSIPEVYWARFVRTVGGG